MQATKSILTIGCRPRGRTGNFVIFRLTPRGVRRPRLLSTRSSRISRSTCWCSSASSSLGGNEKRDHLATNHPDGVDKRQPVRILPRQQRRLVHQSPNGKMGQQKTVKFLSH